MSDTKAQRGRRRTGRGVLLVFSLCALADFVWALLEKRSLAEAAISAVLGLFGTALYLLMYWAAEKNDRRPQLACANGSLTTAIKERSKVDEGAYSENTWRKRLSMTTSAIIWLVVMSLFFYMCGGLCIFKTNALVGWAQRNYTKSKFVQAYPFSGTVMKPWYPTYIRAAGIFIWLWALGIDYLVLFRGFR